MQPLHTEIPRPSVNITTGGFGLTNFCFFFSSSINFLFSISISLKPSSIFLWIYSSDIISVGTFFALLLLFASLWLISISFPFDSWFSFCSPVTNVTFLFFIFFPFLLAITGLKWSFFFGMYDVGFVASEACILTLFHVVSDVDKVYSNIYLLTCLWLHIQKHWVPYLQISKCFCQTRKFLPLAQSL